jgi:pilus assembly protein CpaD
MTLKAGERSMTKLMSQPALHRSNEGLGRRGRVSRLSLVALAAVALGACRADHAGPQIAGWTLIDPAERHPILVSEQPETIQLPVRRGAYGLSTGARRRVAGFLHKFSAVDAGNSRLVISAPSGRSNEVAAMHIVDEVRDMISEAGFPADVVRVEPNPGAHHVRLSYLRVVAKGPECGMWPTNLAKQRDNLNYANFGCATQANFAAMVANPADLLGPRTETPRPPDRRDFQWQRYVQGATTGAQRSADEKVNTESSSQ